MTTHNASAAVSLVKVAQASQKLITVATGYAKGIKNAPNSHIQLEGQLQRIVAASNLALRTINRSSSLCNDPDIDRRLVEWLLSDEPQNCLNTLKAMEKLLKDRPLSRQFLVMIPSVRNEGTIQEAIALFNTRRPSFHFLLTMDIWNQGKEVAQDGTPGTNGGIYINRKDGREREHEQKYPDNAVQEMEQQQEVTYVYYVSSNESAEDIQPDQNEVSTGTTTIGTKLRVDRKQEVDQKEVGELLRWLDGLDCTRNHEATLASRQVDTCTWLFETDIYRSWRHSKIESFWLEGKAGSGKSVLSSSVIDDLKHAQIDGQVLVFFYCDFRNERSTNAAEVMRSLLTQLLCFANINIKGIDCRDAVPELVERKAKGVAPPDDMKLLIRLVSRAAQQFEQPLVVIDALDECKDVEKLVNAVKELNDGHIQLFFTSRPERIIRETFSSLPSISLQDMGSAVAADIKRHITIELDSRPWLRILKQSLKEEIRSALLLGADAMFRWVQCQIDTLAKCPSAGVIRTRLKSLPIGLDETYERILRTIDGNELQRTLVRHALVWLVAALRPLHLSDIMEALKVDLERRTLDDDIVPTHEIIFLDACSSLVTHGARTGIVTLSHFSVKEYLTGELICAQFPQYYIGWQDAHEQLARVCTCYMSLLEHSSESVTNKHSSSHLMAEPTSFDEAEIYDDEESFDTGLLSHFADYALSVGFEHLTYLGWEHDLVFGDMKALQADIRQNPKKWEQIRDSLSIPFHSQTSYNRDWVPPEHYSTLYWSHSKHDSTLCILVQFASASLLERYLDHAALMPSAGTNPLVYAVHFDRVQHARILLSRGAKVNDIDWVVGKPRQALPLELAVEKRAIELVDLLLAAWSRVPEQLFEICVQRAGTVPLRIIRSLFQTDEFPEWIIEHQDKQSLLHNILPQWAYRDVANEGGVLVDITRRLIQVGCDPSAHNSRGQTLLDVMIAEGGVSVVEYLILEHMQMSSNILLAVARAWKNPVPMMHMLVDKGADVHVQTSDGDSVLHVVIDRDLTGMSGVESLLETVKVLVDSGCNPAVCNSAGKTPLHVAATKGHVSVVRYMLSLDILLPPDILLAAVRARECRGRVMRLLVDKGADIHARTCDGDSVLHVALHQAESEETLDLPVTRGRPNGDVLVKLVMLLVHMGCNPAVCNYDGKMPIHIAAAAGNLDVVQYLLSRGIPLPPDILLTNMPVRSPSKKREKRRMHAPSRQIYDAPPYLPLGRLGTESLEFNKANHYLHPLLRYQYHDLTWQSNTSAI